MFICDDRIFVPNEHVPQTILNARQREKRTDFLNYNIKERSRAREREEEEEEERKSVGHISVGFEFKRMPEQSYFYLKIHKH